MTDSVQPTTAADLKPGDFFQHNDIGPELVETLFVYPSSGAERFLVVYLDPSGNTPQAWRLWAVDKIHLATDDEVVAAKATRQRAAFIAGIHDFADWLEAHPQLPQPTRAVFRHSMTTGTDAEKIATVRAAAEHLGITGDLFNSDGYPRIRFEPVPGFDYTIHGFITHAESTT